MTVVTNTMADPILGPQIGRVVLFDLWGPQGKITGLYKGATVSSYRTISDSDSSWQMDLPPNNAITPIPNWWKITELPAVGDPAQYYIWVPSSGSWSLDSLIGAVSSIILQPNLTMHGQTVQATVYLGRPVSRDTVVTLTSSDPTVATVPASVVVPSDSSFAVFNVTAVARGFANITAVSVGPTASATVMVRGDFTYIGEFVYMDDSSRPDYTATIGDILSASTSGATATMLVGGTDLINLAIGTHVIIAGGASISGWNNSTWKVTAVDDPSNTITLQRLGSAFGSDPNTLAGLSWTVVGGQVHCSGNHGLTEGQAVMLKSTTSLPTGTVIGRTQQLQPKTPYFVSYVSPTDFAVRPSQGPDAPPFVLNNDASGDLTLVPYWQRIPTERHVRIWTPTPAGTYGAVFGAQGSGFNGTLSGDATGNDYEMEVWASMGFVAFNVEYAGYTINNDVLRGDDSYDAAWPTTANAKADGSVELNIKQAVRWVFGLRTPSGLEDTPPSLASLKLDVTKGLVAFGASSGCHNAFMLAATGVTGVRAFDCACGWSGVPNAIDSGHSALGQICGYLNTPLPGGPSGPDPADETDQFKFGDVINRITTTPAHPPFYLAGNDLEFIDPLNIENYYSLNPAGQTLWLRHISTAILIQDDSSGKAISSTAHAANYQDWVITESDPHIVPSASGLSIFADTIQFARAFVPTPP